MIFDPAWPHGHVTRDGRKARIICTDRTGTDCSVVVLVVDKNCDKRECVETYTPEGFWAGRESSVHDLVNAPAPKLTNDAIANKVLDEAPGRRDVYQRLALRIADEQRWPIVWLPLSADRCLENKRQ